MTSVEILALNLAINSDPQDLLFNITCLEQGQKFETDDWIYYIEDFIDYPDSEGGDICKIRHDGSERSSLSMRSSFSANRITSVDDKWIYYTDTEGCDRKVNLLGCMDQEI